MTSNWAQRLKRIIKATLRLFLLLLAFHWNFNFTKHEDYYYYSTINQVANHAEIWCGRERKTLAELDDCILEQLTKKCGYEASAEYKEQRDQKLRELDQLHKDIIRLKNQSPRSVIENDELARKENKYKHDLKNFRDSIITNIRQLKGPATIAELDNRQWREILGRDPTNFFFLRPLNWASQKLREHLWMEMLFKLAVIKLILLIVSYPLSLQGFRKKLAQYQQILENRQLNWKQKRSVARKMPFLLIQMAINVIIYVYLGFQVLFVHPYAFDRLHPAFLRRANFGGVIGFFFLRSFFSLGEKMACRRKMPTKKDCKKSLQETIFAFLGFLLFLPFLFHDESQGISQLFLFGSLVDSLGNILICYIRPKRPARLNSATK